jgi:RNA methyltransferase, TrmH family
VHLRYIWAMHPLITSNQNPRIKLAVSLDKPKTRRELGLFLVEGLPELQLAIKAGYEVAGVFFKSPSKAETDILNLVDDHLLTPVSEAVFAKLAYREGTSEVIAMVKTRNHPISALALPDNPLVLILESVEKPGNLGAILRTADAAGIDAVIVCDPQTDFYNPNVIRSSIGAVFTNHLAVSDSASAIDWLKQNHIPIFCTHLHASRPYHEIDYRSGGAIVMGTESTGLSEIWPRNATANIIIPMHGKVDSMNVSVSAAIVIFEALRQRNNL